MKALKVAAPVPGTQSARARHDVSTIAQFALTGSVLDL
jgi:hypothetical protein